MKKNVIFLILSILYISSIAQENPYNVFGHKSDVIYETPLTEYLYIKNSDTTSNIHAIVFVSEKSIAFFLNNQDSIIASIEIQPNDLFRWLSVDPLVSDYPQFSPYSAFENNPILNIDPDGRYVKVGGTEHAEATKQIAISVANELTIIRDVNSGLLSYTIIDPQIALSTNAQQLINAINDQSIVVNVKAENTKYTSANTQYVGGAFMGNTVIPSATGNKVRADQEVNPYILSKMGLECLNPGSVMLHEITEAYQGALLAQKSGISTPKATIADINNPNSVYNQAHNNATPQLVDVVEYYYDANGNEVSSVYNSTTQQNEAPKNYSRSDVYAESLKSKTILVSFPIIK